MIGYLFLFLGLFYVWGCLMAFCAWVARRMENPPWWLRDITAGELKREGSSRVEYRS